MGEMKPTPGPWIALKYSAKRFGLGTVGDGAWMYLQTIYQDADHPEMRANARLIAEAGTVFHNTGLSPVQLVEMVKELKAALNLLLGTADDPNAGWRGAGGSDVLFACEHCGEKHEDCTKLEHADDCPITLARAALAKCEGVKP